MPHVDDRTIKRLEKEDSLKRGTLSISGSNTIILWPRIPLAKCRFAARTPRSWAADVYTRLHTHVANWRVSSNDLRVEESESLARCRSDWRLAGAQTD